MSRRADRLFQIVQILRGRRVTTAALLAERLEVSERTIYRDIRDQSISTFPLTTVMEVTRDYGVVPVIVVQRQNVAGSDRVAGAVRIITQI